MPIIEPIRVTLVLCQYGCNVMDFIRLFVISRELNKMIMYYHPQLPPSPPHSEHKTHLDYIVPQQYKLKNVEFSPTIFYGYLASPDDELERTLHCPVVFANICQ